MLDSRFPSVPSFAVMLGLLLLAGCGGGEGSNVQIEKGERSPAIEGAAAQITAPEDSVVVDSAGVDVTVEAENFETRTQTETDRAEAISNSGNGQHFHVILNNEPYKANYDAGEPFDLGQLTPGPHTLVAFPSRSYHESVKGADAYDVVNFYVQEKSDDFMDFMLDPDEPAIIYSRPKGRYRRAAAERIMLDFYLHNVELSEDGYKARYTIEDGEGNEVASTTLTEWVPAFVTGLDGTYVVNLQLLDGEGNVVPGRFNDTSRKIRVRP